MENYALTVGLVHVSHYLARLDFPYEGAHRYLYYHVLTVFAAGHFSLAVLSPLRPEVAGKAEVQQRVHVWVGEEYYASSPSSVAAVRAALSHIFLAVEAGAAVAAVACLYEYSRFIYELHTVPLRFFLYLISLSKYALQYSLTEQASHLGFLAEHTCLPWYIIQ